jgi:hypothetical protein
MSAGVNNDSTDFAIQTVALVTDAVNTSETSLDFYQTARQNIPEDSHVH